MKDSSNSSLPTPSLLQLLLFVLLLGWLALAPMIIGIIETFFPIRWLSLVSGLLATLLLAVLLVVPTVGFIGLTRQRRWTHLWPINLSIGVTIFYLCLAASFRTISQSGSQQETFLYLIGLPTIILTIGGLGLMRAGGSVEMLPNITGFNRPSLIGLLLTLAIIITVTIGWPLSGTLGDSWTTQMLLIQTLAVTLPDELLFRGMILGLLTFYFPRRKVLASLIALLIYLAYIPSQIVPYGDWLKLLLLIPALPLALIVTELRSVTGSIWAGILFAWIYRTMPLIFIDFRDQLPLIGYPWQGAAYLWMMAGTGGLALILWLGRRFLCPNWSLARPTAIVLALAATLFLGVGWAGLWFRVGYPGFYDDGFLIIMAEQADLSQAETIQDPIARRKFVHDRLVETAKKTQSPLRAALEAANLNYRPFYLINMIRVDGHHRHMADFAELPGVARVMLNPNVRPYPGVEFSPGYGSTQDEGEGVEWNIIQVQANAVWEMGIKGQGIVVAGQDTGYDWQHPAIKGAYRGVVNDRVDHDYDWRDAWSESPFPFDDGQHGTHTMGTIVGNDGKGNQIGIATDARWIGCRNMRRGLGNPASYTDCMEFFLAPYPFGGDPFTEGDVTLAPHVVNNSWACPDIEGCDDDVLEPAIEALGAAGIMMIVSAGNSGPGCQTVDEPPARYDSVFSVGATNRGGEITFFSSRGPVPDTSLLKPDIAAPGSNIRSSLPGGRYGTADGTSMAGPHVTGLVAMIWSANPALIGRIDETKDILRQSATATEISTSCPTMIEANNQISLLAQIEAINGINSCACGNETGSPNNVYGWGEINALEAVKMALEYEP